MPLITVAGTANAITGTITPSLTSYATGGVFSFVVGSTNTTAVTLNIDGLGAKAVTRTGSVALVAGDMVTGQVVLVEYDGTRFQLLNPNAFTNLRVSGLLTQAAGADIASAATIDLSTATGNGCRITGTTPISAVTMATGQQVLIVADSALPLTYNATTNKLNSAAASVTLDAGDMVLYNKDLSGIVHGNIIKANGTSVVAAASGGVSSPQGRVTLTTAVPVTTADVTAATTVYYTPFVGNQVPIYSGSAWVMTTFAELSQATTDNTKSPAAVAASKVYDLFVWSDSGTIRCTRGPAWTNDTTPGTGAGTSQLTMVGGIMTNTVAITNGPGAGLGTYVGTIRSDASSQINDSVLLRYVANAYNDVERQLVVVDTTDSWTYTTATFRQARASSANQVAYVSTQLPFARLVQSNAHHLNNNSTGNDSCAVGIGVDSTSVNSAQLLGGRITNAAGASPCDAFYKGYPGIGAHTLVWLELSAVLGTTTWYGDNGLTYLQSGLIANVRG